MKQYGTTSGFHGNLVWKIITQMNLRIRRWYSWCVSHCDTIQETMFAN